MMKKNYKQSSHLVKLAKSFKLKVTKLQTLKKAFHGDEMPFYTIYNLVQW